MQHEKNAESIKQDDARLRCTLYLKLALAKLYWPCFLLSSVANLRFLVLRDCQKSSTTTANTADAAKLLLTDSFVHVCEETPACPPPPHCESPHSAVVLLAAGRAGCESPSLGRCAGWTGPLDTLTGCRSGSH